MSNLGEREICILQSAEADIRATPYFRYKGKSEKRDPFPNISPSLLSAEHIRAYVQETGLIAPFYIKGGNKSRMKDAAYEGRIGTCAYQYKDKDNYPTRVFSTGDKTLTVPANSIVFAECDLEFRLPEFIALRFNLQIKHVHRGLLLGTGPLVDPGYWGKLCIPLHNLTDEDYIISSGDGLIWLEFTKTTSELKQGEEPIGRPPLGEPFWDIKKFLEKATKPIDYAYPRVGIHSAIPTAYAASLEAAKKAEASAAKSSKYTLVGAVTGILAAVAVVISVFALAHGYYSDMGSQLNEIRPNIAQLQSTLDRAVAGISSTQKVNAALEIDLSLAQESLLGANARIDDLQRQLAEFLNQSVSAAGAVADSEVASTDLAKQ